MATKTRLKSGNVRVQFRLRNLPLISRTFSSESEAQLYEARINEELKTVDEIERSKLPIDLATLFSSFHPDLQRAVKNLPIFAKVLGIITGSEMTMQHLIDEYIWQYNKKDKTLPKRLQWWTKQLGMLRINDVSEEHIRHSLNLLLISGSNGKAKVLPQTTNRFKTNLSSVFEFGRDKYHLKNNPCRHIRSKPEGKGRKRHLSPDQQQALLEASKQSKWDRLYLFSLLALTTGARLGELQKLTFKNIDWDNCTAFCGDTKNSTDKILHLTPNVMSELKRFRSVGNVLIFASPSKPGSPYKIYKELYLAFERAGIERIDEHGERLVVHSLRHSFCSTLSNMGVELHEIAKLAGHKSLQTTVRYSHPDDKRLASLVNNSFQHLAK
jgi:integrase